VEQPVEAPAEVGIDQAPGVDTTEIGEVSRFGYDPLIDEPVTGSGNDDLWTPDCEPDKQGRCPTPTSGGKSR
jgi:hypothetical protein